MDKVKKPVLSIITVFYQGGTKLRADLPITREAAEAEINAAKKEIRDAKLETVDAAPEAAETYLYLSRNALLFHSITVPAAASLIQLVPASTLIK